LTGWPEKPLRELLDPVNRSEAIVAGRSYRQLGVRLWGRGAYEREELQGEASRYATLNRVAVDDVVVNKIWARSGSVAVVPQRLLGCYVSGEFPLFSVDRDKAEPAWIGWLTKWPEFWRRCALAARGTSGKNRIRPTLFLAIPVPLPPLSAQRRIITELDAVMTRLSRAADLEEETTVLLRQLETISLEAGRTGTAASTLGSFASVQSGYAFRSEDMGTDGVRLVRNVNVGHGQLNWAQGTYLPESLVARYERFLLRDGDILVSLDRPLISTGLKAARVRASDLPALLVQRVGRLVVRSEKLDPDYLFAWIGSAEFSSALDPGRSNGVPHISPLALERLPFAPPSLDAQRRIVKHLRRVRGVWEQMQSHRSSVSRDVERILPTFLEARLREAG
jgi:type I restriction enzyme S subunit